MPTTEEERSHERWERTFRELHDEILALRRAVAARRGPVRRAAAVAAPPARDRYSAAAAAAVAAAAEERAKDPLAHLGPGRGGYDELAEADDDSDDGDAAQPPPPPPPPAPATYEGTHAKFGMWTETPMAPPDSIFGIAAQFRADPTPDKVDLVVGAYRTNEGKPYLLPSVARAEDLLAERRQDKAYTPIDGSPEFTRASAELVLGAASPALKERRVALCQTLSGTGALAVVANFYSQFLPIKTKVLLSSPTWANHSQIFGFFGFHDIVHYSYWDPATRSLNFDGMIEDLMAAPSRSIVVLHLCAHNPTGCDPTLEQWRTIGKVLWDKRHHVVFDSAYQGYATGDLDRDAWPARLFEQEIGLEFAVTQSFSKNVGLYGERIGCLSYICKTAMAAERIESQFRSIIRVQYSNPPIHGARIVTMVLTDPKLRQQWEQELKGMSQRIIEMRRLLRSELERLGAPGTWDHITSQIGMFSYTGLSKRQVKHVTEKFHVYMLPSGRVSMAGITSRNCAHVAAAIAEALRLHPDPAADAAGSAALAEQPARIPAPFRMPSPLGMWNQIEEAEPDKIFGLHQRYLADSNPNKINLVVVTDGIRRLDERPALLGSVAEAERRLAHARLEKEYSPIDGNRAFCLAAARMLLGVRSPALQDERVCLCQTLSGTGALAMVASLYSRFLPIQTQVLFSNPTWDNLPKIFANMGFRNQSTYRYWLPGRGLDFDGMVEDIRAAPRHSVVVLQHCAHNPTGMDPTRDQWRQIGRACLERRHHVVLNSAYQGFATGDIESDAWVARMFERELRLEFAVTQSFSKPMGLYGERIGCFMYVVKQRTSAERILSQAKVIARRLYSNPPLHGARIVAMVLNTKELRHQWKQEVKDLTARIQRLRGQLRAELTALGTPSPWGRGWDHIEHQRGVFCLSGLTPAQVRHLRSEFHVYLPINGRISIPGLTPKNISYVATAIYDTVKAIPFATRRPAKPPQRPAGPSSKL